MAGANDYNTASTSSSHVRGRLADRTSRSFAVTPRRPTWRAANCSRSCIRPKAPSRKSISTRAASRAATHRRAMPYTPILATLAYVFSPDGRRVLLVHRNKRPDDTHFGKYNGLGGKLERDEDVVASVRREVREESGLECEAIELRGSISWPGFGKGGEDWFGFVFRIDRWSGTLRPDNREGTLEWVEIDRVLDLPLWEGDRHFLPLVFARDGRP